MARYRYKYFGSQTRGERCGNCNCSHRSVRPLDRRLEASVARDGFPVEIVGFDEDDFFRMAEALGATSFTAWSGFAAGRYSLEQIEDAFGKLCRRAAMEGLRCDLEFIPVFGVSNLTMAWDILRHVDAPNSGLVFDFWHYMRSGPDEALLRSIPGGFRDVSGRIARISRLQRDLGISRWNRQVSDSRANRTLLLQPGFSASLTTRPALPSERP
jgi:Xylose isomerase-like TIM barrel